ncbi:MAG: hypothetical protein PUC29_07115 [Clostridia bacterium]|nr:hypothetical protein [Clostridia bacterium]
MSLLIVTGNENPQKIIISKDTVSTAKGLRAKMTVDDAKALNVEWDDIYFDCDSLFYYTVIFDGGNKYTYAWEMTEEQNNNWLRTIGIYDTFINAPEKYAQPYISGELGVINKITVESAALQTVES